jgi:hypothetical protein
MIQILLLSVSKTGSLTLRFTSFLDPPDGDATKVDWHIDGPAGSTDNYYHTEQQRRWPRYGCRYVYDLCQDYVSNCCGRMVDDVYGGLGQG